MLEVTIARHALDEFAVIAVEQSAERFEEGYERIADFKVDGRVEGYVMRRPAPPVLKAVP